MSYANLCFGFPYGHPERKKYLWNFLYFHMFEESTRLYSMMRLL